MSRNPTRASAWATWAYVLADAPIRTQIKVCLGTASGVFWLFGGRAYRGDVFSSWQEASRPETWWPLWLVVAGFLLVGHAYSLPKRALLLPVRTRRLAFCVTATYSVLPSLAVLSVYALYVLSGAFVVNDGRLHYVPALVGTMPLLLWFVCRQKEPAGCLWIQGGSVGAVLGAMAILPRSGEPIFRLGCVVGVFTLSIVLSYFLTYQNLARARRGAAESGATVKRVRQRRRVRRAVAPFADMARAERWRLWREAWAPVVVGLGVVLVLLVGSALKSRMTGVHEAESVFVVRRLVVVSLGSLTVAGSKVLLSGRSTHEWMLGRLAPMKERAGRLAWSGAAMVLVVGTAAISCALVECGIKQGIEGVLALWRVCGDNPFSVALNVLRGIALLWAATWVTTQLSRPALLAPLVGLLLWLPAAASGDTSGCVMLTLVIAASVALLSGAWQYFLAYECDVIAQKTRARAAVLWLGLLPLFYFEHPSQPLLGPAWAVFAATLVVAPIAGLRLWYYDVRPGWEGPPCLTYEGYREWRMDGAQSA